MPYGAGEREGWPPPRGPKGPDGTWTYTLRDRPLEDNSVEHKAAVNFRDIVETLEDARYAARLTLTDVAARAGVSKTVIADLQSGRSWGRWPSLTGFASAVDARLTFEGKPDVVTAIVARTRRYDRERSAAATAHRSGIQPDTLRRLQSTDSPGCSTVLAIAAALGTPVEATATGNQGQRTTGGDP